MSQVLIPKNKINTHLPKNRLSVLLFKAFFGFHKHKTAIPPNYYRNLSPVLFRAFYNFQKFKSSLGYFFSSL